MSTWYSSFIPSSSVLSGGIAGVSDKLVNFSTANPTKLLDSAFQKANETFGDIKGSFKKLTAGGPDLATILPKPPAEPAANASQIKESSGTGGSAPENTYHRVKLIQEAPGEPTYRVEFEVMPEVSEIRNADYEALQTPHMPGEFQKYKGTKSTQWQITGVFTARTTEEATRNWAYISILRSWVMPYFGDKQRSADSRGKLGAPPPVLTFSGWRGLVGEVPVVLTALNWSWPRDCDWIPTSINDERNNQAVPFPTVMNVNITVVESFSPNQFNSFDLVAFREGRMLGAWGTPLPQIETPTPAEPEGGNQGVVSNVPVPEQSVEATEEVTNTMSEDQMVRAVDAAYASGGGLRSYGDFYNNLNAGREALLNSGFDDSKAF